MNSSQILTKKKSEDAITDTSQLKAPRPRPMQSQEYPPQLNLQEPSLNHELEKCLRLDEVKMGSAAMVRRRSLDMNYSIIGFIQRKIRERSRCRIMSEEINMEGC